MRTNPTTLFPEISAHPTPPARHRKSKRKFQAPLKTASAASKHAAAPAARLPPDQPASEKPTITAPAAKSTIGSAATTTGATHGRPAKAASTNPCRPRHQEIASAPPKCANVRTGILRLETRARTTTLMLSALHAQTKVATFSKAATTPASPGPRHARVDSTKPERRAAPKTASARKTSASATTARALRGLHARAITIRLRRNVRHVKKVTGFAGLSARHTPLLATLIPTTKRKLRQCSVIESVPSSSVFV